MKVIIIAVVLLVVVLMGVAVLGAVAIGQASSQLYRADDINADRGYL